MRAIVVFVVTFIVSMITLVTSFHGFMERSSIVVIAIGLAAIGLALGMLAGWWSWIRLHQGAFLSASFSATMLILLPMVIVSYGFALVLFPFALEWVGMNFLGVLLTDKIRARNQTRALSD